MDTKTAPVAHYEKNVSVDGEGRSISMEICLPMPKDAFEVDVKNEILRLRTMPYEHITIGFDEEETCLTFLQSARYGEDDYVVEVGTKLNKTDERPTIFRKCETTSQAVVAIFFSVLCEKASLDLTEWENVTDEIFPKSDEDDEIDGEEEETEIETNIEDPLDEELKGHFSALQSMYTERFGEPFDAEFFDNDLPLCVSLMVRCLEEDKPFGDPECSVGKILKSESH